MFTTKNEQSVECAKKTIIELCLSELERRLMTHKIVLAVGQEWHGEKGFWRRIVKIRRTAETAYVEWFGVGVDGRSTCELKTFRAWIKRTGSVLKDGP